MYRFLNFGKRCQKIVGSVAAFLLVCFLSFPSQSARAGEAAAASCDPTNGPCDCAAAAQLPNQRSGVTGYATMSSESSVPNEDSCSAVGQCQDSTADIFVPPFFTVRGSTVLLNQEDAQSAVVGTSDPNPAGLDEALADLDWYRVHVCAPLTISGVRFQFQAGQETEFFDPVRPPYTWIDFFVVLTLSNGDRVIGYEQHGITFDCGDPGGSTVTTVGNNNCLNDEGTQTAGFHGFRGLFFEGVYEVTEVTFYFDGSDAPGFLGAPGGRPLAEATFGEGSIVLMEVGADDGACDPTNGPCDCDLPEQLPLQSGGVTGYGVASTTTGNLFPLDDSSVAVGQAFEVGANNLPSVPQGDPDRGRTSLRNTLNYGQSTVIGTTDPNPPGLDHALNQLDWFEVNLCDPLCISGLSQVVSLAQEREVCLIDAGAYEWLHYFVVLTLADGDRVVAYEQHGVSGGPDIAKKFNEPIIGHISNPESAGTQGDREITFGRSYEVSKVGLYFNATTGFSYVGGSAIELTECFTARIDLLQTGGSTELDEADVAATDSYTVVLGQAPVDQTEVELDFDGSQLDVVPDTLTFTDDDWFVEQTVTVSVIDDGRDEGVSHTSVISHTAFGGGFDGVTADLTVTITDNDSVGACCLPDGSCVSAGDEDCINQDGIYQGNDTACEPEMCPVTVTGACCFSDGSCEALLEADCVAQDGIYQGNDTTCEAESCPITVTGACCFSDGSCEALLEADCMARDGTYQGNDTACEPEMCPVTITGSCCLPGGSCEVLLEADCVARDGTYQGDDVACDPGLCGVSFRRGDCDQSGELDFNDAIFHLRFLFLGENEDVVNLCLDACDSDDSGDDDFTDDINTLEFLFLGTGVIPDPGPIETAHPCGVDPTEGGNDVIDCVSYDSVTACP